MLVGPLRRLRSLRLVNDLEAGPAALARDDPAGRENTPKASQRGSKFIAHIADSTIPIK
jgi:hypothetical protein